MELSAASEALAALAQPLRLRIYRLLVRHGASGLAAGEIGAALDVPAPTLSFHLRQLRQAGLLRVEARGRSRIFGAEPERLRALQRFLGLDCAQGRRDFNLPLTPDAFAPAEADPRPHVLFLCSRNSARSQIAEALLRRAAGERYRISSAGLRPAAIHPLTLQVLEEEGLATEELQADDLGSFLGQDRIDHAIVVCSQADADCPGLLPFCGERLFWPFSDPAEARPGESEAGQLQRFRQVRGAIGRRIENWLAGREATRSGSQEA